MTALYMLVSGSCAILAGVSLTWAPLGVTIALCLLWGMAIIADSAQFSACVIELAEPTQVGTALTLQLGIGYLLSALTIYLVPVLVSAVSYTWAFAVVAPGPLVGAVLMLYLSTTPRGRAMNHGKG
jgi:hypothetical protein